MRRSSNNTVISRRSFIKKTAQGGAGLSLAIMFSGCMESETTPVITPIIESFEANAFVTITSDNKVTVLVTKLEMGQGTHTGLATLVAEELDADWAQILVNSAPVDPKRYGWQGTGGSSSIAVTYKPLREAGAAARQMLVLAAAQLWQVNANDIQVKKGLLTHSKTKRQATFGELASLAAQQPLPTTITLKDPTTFTLIGKKLSRKDTGKTDGTAVFTQDIQLPGMLTAVVAHPPRFGAVLVDFDAKEAKKLAGVVDVVRIDNAVAVLAHSFWQAKKGRDRLQITWNEDNAFQQSTDELFTYYHKLAESPGVIAEQKGDVESAFRTAHSIVEASYNFPFLAHAAMEPLNCVVEINGDQVEIWNGCQYQTSDQKAVASLLGISPDHIKINTLLAGGSFGRRSNPHSDYVLEATRIAKSYGKPVPIKLVWTREDDTQAGYFRPMYVHKLKAGLDKEGNIVAWRHRIVGQSISMGNAFEAIIKNGIDPLSVEGAVNLPYQIPNRSVELHTVDLPVPVMWWRSVASTHTAHSTETFIDKLAAVTKQDPLAFRLKLLQDQPKHQQVLQLVAEKSHWGEPLPEGRTKGIAVHKSFGTTVAQVAEVQVEKNGDYRVERVTCAVDCGLAINPDVVVAQMEGGIGFGLSPTLLSEITFNNGKVMQSSFHDYLVVRMKHMPDVDVHIVPSNESPTGVGEPGVPVIAPAVVNALVAVKPKQNSSLPFGLT
jgi:isoquinoline 1-oxidoreductase beta subunit